MRCDDACRQIYDFFHRSADRYAVHAAIGPLIARLCTDREFLHDALRQAIIRSEFLACVAVLSLPIFESGDISLVINLFPPLRDRTPDVAADYIHHHGWRLLSTGIILGAYDTIQFERGSHRDRTDGVPHLRVDSLTRHSSDQVMFVDSHTPHLVFHPPALTATLALWSADRRMINQAIKRSLGTLPAVRRIATRTIRRLGLGGRLGLNETSGVFYRPIQGRIVEVPHDGELDVDREEAIACVLKFMQLIRFDDRGFLDCLQARIPTHAAQIAQIPSGDPLADTGIRGNPKRQFTRREVLDAIEQDGLHPPALQPR